MPQAKTKLIRLGDREIQVFAASVLGKVIKKSNCTLRQWEKGGFIPKPILRLDNTQLRWYTREEIEIYKRLVEEEQIKKGNNFAKTNFKTRIFGEIEILKRRILGELK